MHIYTYKFDTQYEYIHVYMYMYTIIVLRDAHSESSAHGPTEWVSLETMIVYGVATISTLLEIIGLLCKRAL